MNYSELTQRYFETAPGAGTLGPGAARGAAGSRAQGTWVQFELQIDAPGGRIAAVGRLPQPALPEGVQALRRRFDLPVEKLGRLLVVEDAWLAAMADAGVKS